MAAEYSRHCLSLPSVYFPSFDLWTGSLLRGSTKSARTWLTLLSCRLECCKVEKAPCTIPRYFMQPRFLWPVCANRCSPNYLPTHQHSVHLPPETPLPALTRPFINIISTSSCNPLLPKPPSRDPCKVPAEVAAELAKYVHRCERHAVWFLERSHPIRLAAKKSPVYEKEQKFYIDMRQFYHRFMSRRATDALRDNGFKL